MARPSSSTSSPLAAEVDKVLTVLTDPSLTSEGCATAVVKQVAELQFSTPEREGLMTSELAAFATHARELRMSADHLGLRRAAGELYKKATELARPIPPPSPVEVVRAYNLVQNHQWPPWCVEFLIDHLQPGDFPLGAADRKGINTATRRITIDELVTFNRPRSMTDDHFPRWKASVMAPSLGQSRPGNEE